VGLTVPKKTKTAVNLVKPKPNQKLQFFCKNGTENRTEVIFCQPHTPTLLIALQRLHDFSHTVKDNFGIQAFTRTSYTKFQNIQAPNPFSRTFHGLEKWQNFQELSTTFKKV